MTLVVDASVVVAALVDGGPDGDWARLTIASDVLAAPQLLQVEAASVLSRAVRRGVLERGEAALALDDLLALRVELVPFTPVARRVWELRENVTPYDAWYVAIAEEAGAPLATLDRRLATAQGPRCEFQLPPEGL